MRDLGAVLDREESPPIRRVIKRSSDYIWVMSAFGGDTDHPIPRTSRRLLTPLRKWSALRASAINLRIVPCLLWMPDVYLRSIEPLIAIVLGCMRWKYAQAN